MRPNYVYYAKHGEMWHGMFDLHAKLVDDYDVDILDKFKYNLDRIQYVHTKPYEALGKSHRSKKGGFCFHTMPFYAFSCRSYFNEGDIGHVQVCR